MTIKLKPGQERIIKAEIESGPFGSANEVFDHALAALNLDRPKDYRRTSDHLNPRA